MNKHHAVLFEAMNIGQLQLKNRYSMAPMGTLGCVDSDGAYNSRGIEYYIARAKGGVGLIITARYSLFYFLKIPYTYPHYL